MACDLIYQKLGSKPIKLKFKKKLLCMQLRYFYFKTIDLDSRILKKIEIYA